MDARSARAWLSKTRDQMQEMPGVTEVTPIVDISCDVGIAAGYQTIFEPRPDAAALAFAVVSMGDESLTVRLRTVKEDLDRLTFVVNTLRVDDGLTPRSGSTYSVLGYTFQWPGEIAQPTHYSFASADGAERLDASWVVDPPPLGELEWNKNFVYHPDSVVHPMQWSPPEAGAGAARLTRPLHWIESVRYALALRDGASESLVQCQGYAQLGGRYLWLLYRSQRSIDVAYRFWLELLSLSMPRPQ